MVLRKTPRGSSPSPTPSPGVPAASPMAAASGRSQPVILKQPTRPRPRARCAELAGGAAADCAAVCCCCPCMLVDIVVLAAVRLPAGLCRRAVKARAKRKDKARKRKEAALLGPKGCAEGDAASSVSATEVGEKELGGEGERLYGTSPAAAVLGEARAAATPSPEQVAQMEEEMWGQFYNAGFWRSPSQLDVRR